MKALTLYEPWASLVALGEKKIETRSWVTRYRGPLAIHAGATRKAVYMDLAWQEPFYSLLTNRHTPVGGTQKRIGIKYNFGCVLAICNLTDCIEITSEFASGLSEKELAFGDYTPGRFAWILSDIKRLKIPIPAKGRQRLWNWES